MPRKQNYPGGPEYRRAEVERWRDGEAQYFEETGLIIVNGTGESIHSVSFSEIFTERPRYSWGGELAEGQAFELGSLPACSMVILTWDQRAQADGSPLYVGATFGILAAGLSEDQVMVVQWHVRGVGLRAPTTGALDG